MKIHVAWLALALLAGCSKSAPSGQSLATYDVEPPASEAAPPAPSGNPAAPIAVAVPQMAYEYSYVFRLPGDAIRRAQDAHVALCDRLGPARCQLLSLSSGGGEGDAATAKLKLRVASRDARAFGQALQQAVAKAGGRAVSDTIAAEDVSKAIVDTEARLRQRTLLVERLTEILRTRTGKVSELVEAERSVAAAQEEIDQARGWLAELRRRVAMSEVTVEYQSVATEPVSRSALGDAVAQSLSGFTTGVTTLAIVAIMLLPWLIVLGAGWWFWRRVIIPRRLRREEAHTAAALPADEE